MRIITDSASDITQEEALKYNIDVIPLSVSFNGVAYKDGVDISKVEFYNKLIESPEIPKTSMISSFIFEEYFDKYKDEEIIYIGLSSKLSNSYNQALIAAKEKNNVYTVDSLNVAMGQRVLVEYAIRLRDKNIEAKEIVKLLNDNKERIEVIALLDTLDYLQKGGRISKTVAFAGKILTIKPVVGVKNGKVELIGKARGSKNGNNLLRELVTTTGGIDFNMPFSLGYSGVSTFLLENYINNNKDLYNGDISMLPISMIGPTIGTHVGPNAIGVAFFSKTE